MVRNSSVGEEWELEKGKGMKDGVRVSVEALAVGGIAR